MAKRTPPGSWQDEVCLGAIPDSDLTSTVETAAPRFAQSKAGARPDVGTNCCEREPSEIGSTLAARKPA
jgi:hypothetical protein